MNYLPAYLDSSAIFKLIAPEPESQALEHELRRWPDLVSSALAAVECHRALKRAEAPGQMVRRANGVLDAIALVKLDAPVLRLAEHLGSSDLRSLDAIHLATALSLGDMPEAFVTYDDRLAQAARRAKLPVLQPGTRRARARLLSPRP